MKKMLFVSFILVFIFLFSIIYNANNNNKVDKNLLILMKGETLFCEEYSIQDKNKSIYLETSLEIGFKKYMGNLYRSRVGIFDLNNCFSNYKKVKFAAKIPKNLKKINSLKPKSIGLFEKSEFQGSIIVNKEKCSLYGRVIGNLTYLTLEYLVDTIKCKNKEYSINGFIGNKEHYEEIKGYHFSYVSGLINNKNIEVENNNIYFFCLDKECEMFFKVK